MLPDDSGVGGLAEVALGGQVQAQLPGRVVQLAGVGAGQGERGQGLGQGQRQQGGRHQGDAAVGGRRLEDQAAGFGEQGPAGQALQESSHDYITAAVYTKLNTNCQQMLQSFSPLHSLTPLLTCHQCQRKAPHSFVLLHCDHVTCAQCLAQCTSPARYRCRCGQVTLLEGVGSRVSIHGRSGDGSIRHSVKNSKNSTSTKNVSRLNTESYSRGQGYGRTGHLLQKSRYPVFAPQQQSQQREQSVRSEHLSQQEQGKNYAQSQELQQQQQQVKLVRRNTPTHYSKCYKTDKENYNTLNTTFTNVPMTSTKIPHDKYNTSEEIKSELAYMKLQHERLLEGLERSYYRARGKINEEFKKMEESCQELVLEAMFVDQRESRLDFGKIIKAKYENTIGSVVERLTQDIRKYTCSGSALSLKELARNQQVSQEPNKFRFSSPQPYRNSSRMFTEPGLYSPSHSYQKMYQNESLAPHSSALEANLYRKQAPMPCRLGGYIVNPPRLHKKPLKKKTNLIIQF